MNDGLLNQPPQPGAPTLQGVDVNSPASKGNVERMDKLQGLVLAGKKVLYDPSMKGKLLEGVTPEQPAKSAADVAATVMLLLIQKDAKGVAPDAVVPAGLVLVGEVLDFLSKAHGVEVDEAISEQAIGMFVNHMLGAFSDQGQPPAGPQAMPGQPPSPPAQPQGGGLLGAA